MHIKEQDLLRFKYSVKVFLDTLSIGSLRAYGREIGVERSAAKKKGELIQDIISVLCGERMPIERSKLGAPVKNDYVDPRIPQEIEQLKKAYDIPLHFGVDAVTQEDKQKEQTYIERLQGFHNNRESVLEFCDSGEVPDYLKQEHFEVVGQLKYDGETTAYLYSKNGSKAEKDKVLMPLSLVEKYKLLVGDVVCCQAVRSQNGALVAAEVVTVNDMPPAMLQRVDFNTAEVVYPFERIRFYDYNFTEQSQTMKAVDWLVPIRKGQRCCLLSAPKAGKTTFLYDLAKAVRVCNTDIWLCILLLDQPPETVAQFRKGMEGVDFVAATYEDDCDKQVELAEFLLLRAKRYAESGKSVLFLVDSFSALARAYNETERSLGGKTLAGGMESKTVYYVKKFLGSARKFKAGGSITMLGALTTDSGNPADDLIAGEMCSIANVVIELDEKMARNRIFPNIDIGKTLSIDARYPNEHEEDTFRLWNYLRKEFLPLYDNETLSRLICTSKTYEELYSKAMSGVRAIQKK